MPEPALEERVKFLETDHSYLDSVLSHFIVSTERTFTQLAAERRAGREVADERFRRLEDALLEERRKTEASFRLLNKQMGEMSHRLGTLVEDLVAPSLSRVIEEVLGQEVIDLSVRRRRKLADGRRDEFDAIAETPEVVCLASVKSTLKSAHVDELAEKIPLFREFFPEYDEKPIIGILRTLYVDESVVRYAEKIGFVTGQCSTLQYICSHPAKDPDGHHQDRDRDLPYRSRREGGATYRCRARAPLHCQHGGGADPGLLRAQRYSYPGAE